MRGAFIVGALLLFGCRTAEHDTTLGAIASTTRVTLTAYESELVVELVPSNGSCPTVHATAALGDAPMKVVEQGHSDTHTGTSVGEILTSCIYPRFTVGLPAAGTQALTQPDLTITDSSTTFRIRLADGLTARAIHVASSSDGQLHAGKSATVALAMGASTLDITPSSRDTTTLTIVDSHDALFYLSGQDFGGRKPKLAMDASGTFTFDVPSDLQPGPARLGLTWHAVLTVAACEGPVACDAREEHRGALEGQNASRPDRYEGDGTLVVSP